jgi:TatA/E family protein of Tat protein translocase
MSGALAFIEGLGGPELLMVLFVVLLLFGANRLPELARGLGKAMREVKKATSGVEEEFRSAMQDKPEPSEEAKRFAPKPVFPPYPPARAIENPPSPAAPEEPGTPPPPATPPPRG